MSIVIRPKGEARAAAEAGKIIGKAEAKRQQQQIDAELASQKKAQEWELEKLALRSQQDFQHELRLRQINLEKEARAEEWEIEKMQRASLLDFEMEEKERLKKLEEITNSINAIQKEIDSGHTADDDPTIKARLTNLQLQYDAVKTGTKPLTLDKLKSTGGKFGVTPWYMNPQYANTPAAMATRQRAEQVEKYSDRPWYLNPANINDPDAIAAQKEHGIFLSDTQRAEMMSGTNVIDELLGRVEETDYSVGQTIVRAGKKWKIVGFDTDGEPLVEEIR